MLEGALKAVWPLAKRPLICGLRALLRALDQPARDGDWFYHQRQPRRRPRRASTSRRELRQPVRG